MRKAIAFAALAAAGTGCVLVAQQTRKEITKATTPHDDSKPNSVSVPDVYAMSGKFDRVVALRFKHQTDLLAGIEKMVKEQKIKDAVILSAIGLGLSFYAVTGSGEPSWIGLILLFVGVGYVALWWLEGRHLEQTGATRAGNGAGPSSSGG